MHKSDIFFGNQSPQRIYNVGLFELLKVRIKIVIEILSYYLSDEHDDVSSRQILDVLQLPAGRSSFFSVSNALNLPTCLKKVSVANLICPSTDWCVTSMDKQ